MFTALALLTKGLVGVAFVGLAWLALVVPWAFETARDRRAWRPWILAHVGALAVLVLVALAWIVPFRAAAGEELWNLWFWENQVGRLTGDTSLGHTSPELRPFYYVGPLLVSTLVWAPMWIVWIAQRASAAARKRRLSREDLLLIGWGLGGILLLTASSTKRSVYLEPLLPAFALMAAATIELGLRAWLQWYFRGLQILAAVVVFAMLFAPALQSLVPSGDLRASLSTILLFEYGLPHLVVLLALALAAFPVLRRTTPFVPRTASALSVAYVALLSVGPVAREQVQNPEHLAREFVAALPVEDWPRTAFVALDESARGYLYLYGGMALDIVDVPRLATILAGEDPDYDRAIFRGDLSSLGDSPPAYRVAAFAHLCHRPPERNSRHELYLLEPGASQSGVD